MSFRNIRVRDTESKSCTRTPNPYVMWGQITAFDSTCGCHIITGKFNPPPPTPPEIRHPESSRQKTEIRHRPFYFFHGDPVSCTQATVSRELMCFSFFAAYWLRQSFCTISRAPLVMCFSSVVCIRAGALRVSHVCVQVWACTTNHQNRDAEWRCASFLYGLASEYTLVENSLALA